MRSFASSDDCTADASSASVQGGPAVAGLGAGPGFGTDVHVGVPALAAWSSWPAVSGPTMPSAVRPGAVWNQRIAAWVSPPSLPSTGPAWQPSEFSWRCNASIPALLLVPDPAAPAVPAAPTRTPAAATAPPPAANDRRVPLLPLIVRPSPPTRPDRGAG